MMRSLYAGVSGLQNHQTRMDVIGNNISNVNTVGFKRGRVNFQDMLSQTTSGAAAPNDVRGGVNPKQVGLGMTIASIDTIHTQGSMQSTGIITDIAIKGEGFFVMQEGASTLYTRAGAFDVDKNGILVNPSNGLRVQGWQAQDINGEAIIRTAQDLTDLYIPIGQKDPANATTLVEFACNLDKRTGVINNPDDEREVASKTWEVNKKIFDSTGIEHDLRISFTRDPNTENQWIGNLVVDPLSPAEDINAIVGVEGGNNTFTVRFNNYGMLESVTDAAGNVDAEEELNINVAFNVLQTNPEGGAQLQRQNFLLNLGEVGSTTNSMTQYADTSTTKAFRQDGFTLGYMDTFRIDDAGIITGTYSNGNRRVLGQIALATFANPEGLEKAGDSTYVVSNNSGDALIGPAGIGGKGKFMSGALEMSNVDLADAFTDMIVTQRGFQANSKTITTSDQMIQELLGLKR